MDLEVLITQLETPLKATIHALKSFHGTSILNAAPALENFPKELLIYSKIFCVNEHEASIMSGANVVVITLGESGAVYGQKDSEEFIHIPVSRKVEKVVDTTGAGDAFIGSLAYFLVKYPNSSLTNLIGAACEVASHSVQKPGTQSSFPSAKDLNLDDIAKKTYKFHLL
uniref:Carbohydrate kinase PfkB domain-containing protein n=1 Tax=Megaselia scalaris TaxID=36166 RepID=T1GR89_MEGSC